jgi:hypothetical protein
MLDIQAVIDDARCFRVIRDRRWPEEVLCAHCDSRQTTRQGHDETPPARRCSLGRSCSRRLDDLTGTSFAGHHRPLRVWVLALYFLWLNLSNEQIARALDLDPDDAQRMGSRLRRGTVQHKPPVVLTGEVECDEVYVVAGQKGHPDAVQENSGSAGDDA